MPIRDLGWGAEVMSQLLLVQGGKRIHFKRKGKERPRSQAPGPQILQASATTMDCSQPEIMKKTSKHF